MSATTRAWLVDFLSALISAAITAGVVTALGGPLWAAVGFALVHYHQFANRAQERLAKKPSSTGGIS